MARIRVPVLGCAVVVMGCSAHDAAVSSETGSLSSASLVAGIERQREGNGSGTVVEVQQRSVHFGNAAVLAAISEGAYDVATPASLAALGVAGVRSVQNFDNHCSGGYAIYAELQNASVLAFRGTQPTSADNVITDVDDAFHDYPFVRDGIRARVHDGFLYQFDSLWNADPACGVPQGVKALLAARSSGAPLYLTGHSLGGALATLALAQTFVDGPRTQFAALYTFGGPKVGNDIFAEVLGDDARASKTPIYRFVHKNDIVVTQPRPLGSVIHEPWQHPRPTGEAEDALQVWFDDHQAKIGTFALFVGFSIPDHMLAGYIDDISKNARARGELR